RKRNRYARLLKELKTTGGSPTAGTELDFFLKYLTGENKLKIINKPDEGDLKRYGLAVHPFAIEAADATADSRYKVEITAYSFAGIDVAGLSNNDLGISFIEGGEQLNQDYYPALIKPSFRAGGYTGNSDKTSAVTGKKYNYVPTRTFSIPFGRTTAAEDAGDGSATSNISASDELDVVRHLKTKIAAGANADKLKSISYEAEFFNEVSRAKDATAANDIPEATVTLAS
ncbi:MAG: hypothetical protein AAFW67_13915, partial [Cyanobacteria bacterium J06638_38]